jgi:two-component system, cell cycle response regulator DivK
MSLRIASEQLADLRQDAQLLIERTGDQEGQLEAFVAVAEGDLRQAEAAVSHAADDLDLGEVRHLLSGQLERRAAGAAAAKRLLAGAHQQHAAACRLLEDLNGGGSVRAESPNAVLVVDDYGDVRDLVARVLEDAGFVVRTAANGLEALIAAYEMRPGVIVMDVSMPVLDGVEATRLIKAGDATRHARVIAYTGNPSFDTSPTRTLFAAVLTKPATPAAVLATVQQVAGCRFPAN